MDGGPVNDVVVVERHDRGTCEDVEIVDQADQHGLGWRGTAGLQQGERVDTSLGFGGLNRCHEVGHKQSEICVARVESQPRHPALQPLRRQPLRQKCGLAEPSRCRDQHQPRPFASVHAHLIAEASALHKPATRRGQVQLGTQHRHSVSVDALSPQRWTSEHPPLSRARRHVIRQRQTLALASPPGEVAAAVVELAAQFVVSSPAAAPGQPEGRDPLSRLCMARAAPRPRPAPRSEQVRGPSMSGALQVATSRCERVRAGSPAWVAPRASQTVREGLGSRPSGRGDGSSERTSGGAACRDAACARLPADAAVVSFSCCEARCREGRAWWRWRAAASALASAGVLPSSVVGACWSAR